VTDGYYGGDYVRIDKNIIFDGGEGLSPTFPVADHISIIGNIFWKIKGKNWDWSFDTVTLDFGATDLAETYFNTFIDSGVLHRFGWGNTHDTQCNQLINLEGVVDGDLRSGVTIAKNAFYNTNYKFLGYTEEDLKNISWDELSQYGDNDRDFNGSYELVTWFNNGSVRDKRFIRKDGKSVYGNVSLETIYKKDGSIDYIIILLRDISDRIAANNALRKSEELLRSFFNAGYVGMSIISGDKKFQQVNDALCDIVGYSREELLGMSILDLLQNSKIRLLLNWVKKHNKNLRI